jgi:hypothetical protein
MKPIIFTKAIMTSLVFLLYIACQKDSKVDTTYTGTLGYYKCGTAIIDVEGNTGTGGGVLYTDPASKVHNNAVQVKNFCYLMKLYTEKQITGKFTFRISKESRIPEQSCATEYCLITGPSASVFVYDVQKAD